MHLTIEKDLKLRKLNFQDLKSQYQSGKYKKNTKQTKDVWFGCLAKVLANYSQDCTTTSKQYQSDRYKMKKVNVRRTGYHLMAIT